MTITDEAAAALTRDEAAVTLARETVAALDAAAAMLAVVGNMIRDAAEAADDAIAGGAPDRPVLHELINANLRIAAAARGEAATL